MKKRTAAWSVYGMVEHGINMADVVLAGASLYGFKVLAPNLLKDIENDA